MSIVYVKKMAEVVAQVIIYIIHIHVIKNVTQGFRVFEATDSFLEVIVL